MPKDLNDLKISSEFKNKIKNEYKKEKEKPKYKIRKMLNYEVEISTGIAMVLLVIIVATPIVDTVNRVKDLTYYKIEVGGEENELTKREILKEENKSKN
ncbi:MAG: hypothetical protein ACRDD2_01540 [Sarcina sp.]